MLWVLPNLLPELCSLVVNIIYFNSVELDFVFDALNYGRFRCALDKCNFLLGDCASNALRLLRDRNI